MRCHKPAAVTQSSAIIRKTLEEARQFLQLSDVTSLQEEMVEGLGVKMRDSLVATDMETLLKTWMSGMGGGLEEMQKQFWSQFTGQNIKDSE